jgi:peptidylprolyl isomerase
MALLYEILKNNAAAITEMKKYIELSPNASDLRKAQDKIYEWDTDTSTNTTVITKTDTTTTASGLKYIILSNGKGVQAANGNTVKVNYTGYFTDGRKFDSSIDNGEPSSFVLGQGKAIKGFDEGVALMKPGEKVRLIIPYQLGYGDNAVGPIPAKSTLIFDVELLEVK